MGLQPSSHPLTARFVPTVRLAESFGLLVLARFHHDGKLMIPANYSTALYSVQLPMPIACHLRQMERHLCKIVAEVRRPR